MEGGRKSALVGYFVAFLVLGLGLTFGLSGFDSGPDFVSAGT